MSTVTFDEPYKAETKEGFPVVLLAVDLTTDRALVIVRGGGLSRIHISELTLDTSWEPAAEVDDDDEP